MSRKLHCSFCGKSQDDVGQLIVGPNNICICDADIRLCGDILREVEIKAFARSVIRAELVDLKASVEGIVERRNHGLFQRLLRKVGAA